MGNVLPGITQPMSWAASETTELGQSTLERVVLYTPRL